jgi:urate oxidase
MKLSAHRYGKSRVRVMKVLQDGPVHTIKELTARLLLEGDFDRSFTAADNTLVIATDTMKNTVHVLAYDHLGLETEPFARVLSAHFLERHRQVSRVTVTLDERVWTRLPIAEVVAVDRTASAAVQPGPKSRAGHPHSFVQTDVARPFTRLVASAGETVHDSGIRHLTILKSTGSGFERFHRDELTTLAETRDRILATAARATWRWIRKPSSYLAANRAIVEAMLVPFAQHYSPSVQATLFEMATAALDACPEIGRVTLALPNLHCLPIDLTPFDRTNRGELFLPTDEPHGYIEATVSR